MKTSLGVLCILLSTIFQPGIIFSDDSVNEAISYHSLIDQIFSLQSSYSMKLANPHIDKVIEITRVDPKSIMLSLLKLEDEELQITQIRGGGEFCGIEYTPQIKIEFTLQKGSGESTIVIWCSKVLICFEGKQYYFKSSLNNDLYQSFSVRLFDPEFWTGTSILCN